MRPSLKSYEDSIFALYTFFTAISPFCEVLRALQSLINAGFAGFHAADTRRTHGKNESVEKVENEDFCRAT